ncbi:MAG: ribonuclease domain-containing protein [Pseudoxanthomonas sp.]
MASPNRSLTRWPAVLAALLLVGLWAWQQRHGAQAPVAAAAVSAPPAAAQDVPPATLAQRQDLPDFLPPEARATLTLIQRGGPFPYPQDGQVFGNFEGHLPRQPRGWYHEYTVETPGRSNRGTRRIVTGGNPPSQWWYSDDHYASFRRFEVGR